MVSLDSAPLAREMQRVLLAKGVVKEAAEHVVTSLVETSLRGTDSHGINLFPHYCRAVDAGRIEKAPRIEFHATAAATGIVEADHAFGHHAGAVAMDHAIALAKRNGIGAVGVRDSTHFGAAAYFGLRAPERDCIGFAFTNADALVKVHGGIQAFFGTNPICCCAPMANEEPFCLDMATSQISWNRIKNARRAGETLAPGLAYDAEGREVSDPDEAASLAPAGLYKGFGLGMMVDLLCALLSGGPISKDLLPMYTSPIEARRRIGHFFMAIDVASFLAPEAFAAALRSMADRVRAMESAPGVEGVMVPGDPEKKTRVLRLREGIPIDEEVFSEFLALSPEFGGAVLDP